MTGSDLELAARAGAGDERAATLLLSRYEGLLSFLCRRFFDDSATHDDLRQEARVGLFKAWRDYDPDAGLSFRNFVVLVVNRHLATCIRTKRRLKHEPLTFAARVAETEDGDTVDIIDLVADPRAIELVEVIAERDRIRLLVDVIVNDLSRLEREALIGLVFNDESYVDIESRLGHAGGAGCSQVKVVDNALMRARGKVRRAFGDDAAPLGAAA